MFAFVDEGLVEDLLEVNTDPILKIILQLGEGRQTRAAGRWGGGEFQGAHLTHLNQEK